MFACHANLFKSTHAYIQS